MGNCFNACATHDSFLSHSRLIGFVPLDLRAVRGGHGMEPHNVLTLRVLRTSVRHTIVTLTGGDRGTYHIGGLRSTRRLPALLRMEWVISTVHREGNPGSSLDDVVPGNMADERLMECL